METVDRYGKRYPQEIVFVHMDNTCYFLGDTLYYTAYVQRSDSGTPSSISQVLYADLFNQDGYLVERQTIRLKNGKGWGSFVLADTLYAGFYELRAYTRWQLNWGITEHQHSAYAEKWFLKKDMAKDFFRDYEKLYSRVFPLYNKPPKGEMPEKIMSTRPLRRYFKSKNEKEEAEVHLFPEGGNWVAGVQQRIAFEANNQEGKHLQGTLRIYDAAQKMVAEGETLHQGRGVIEFTAHAGEPYTASFAWDSGEVKNIELPLLQETGVAIHVSQNNEQITVRLSKNNLKPKSLGMAILTHGRITHYCEVENDTICIDSKKIPEGVAELILFDVNGRIWADRMVFVSHFNASCTHTTVEGLPQMCEPFQPIALKLKSKPHAEISIAIRDEAMSDPVHDNGTLYTEMLLCSQIKGFVENPGYYFDTKNKHRSKALDLLLMVQGWRRYKWEEMKKPFVAKEPFEISPIFRGDVHKFTALDQEDYFYVRTPTNPETLYEGLNAGGISGPLLLEPVSIEVFHPFMAIMDDMEDEKMGLKAVYNSKRNDPIHFQHLIPVNRDDSLEVHAQFAQPVNVQNNALMESVPVRQGSFALQGPHADSPYYTYLTATSKGEAPILVTGDGEVPQYSVRIRPFHPRYVKPYTYYQTTMRTPTYPSDTQQVSADKTQMMREVSVGAKRNGLRKIDLTKPVMVMDAYDAFNEVVDAGLSPAWYAGTLSFAINLARLYVGEMGIERSYRLERRWDGKNLSSNIPQKEQYRYNHMDQLYKVAIYTDYAPRMEGDKKYEASNQPSVSVDFRLIPDNGRRMTYRDRRYVMTGYNFCEDFYHPQYTQKPLPDVKDYRRTLYWNPALKMNEKGETEILFYNNCRQNNLDVSIEGIMPDGTILSSGCK